ncbi:DoxX family protein [Flavobacterium amniphilum]|uniref:DoxX family protein n=1 Tax=Flavobacterium amniphilum TaxID=1834035 RepID=UPI00202AC0C3|nr:DoxX family protein [Flavobacterium amniphilum]MCL9804404.1 DoxX family protein [Flavobacterium amniphilum]
MKVISFSNILKLIVAVILLQTLFFKFTAQPESVYIFTTLEAEPFGRIGSGIVELIASIMLFFNKTRFYGAFIAMGTMLVAILSHLFILGIEVNNDKGMLFTLAVITFVCSCVLLYKFRKDINFLR